MFLIFILRGIETRPLLEIAPQVFVPDIPAGPSNQLQDIDSNTDFNDEDDKICCEVLENVENLGLYDDIEGKTFFFEF